MRRHTNRGAYYVPGEGVLLEPPEFFDVSGCPFAGANAAKSPAVPLFKFGRMFDKSSVKPGGQEFKDLSVALVALGLCMNDPGTYGRKPLPPPPDESTIPAGYTYLGQFIAHEITFDNQDPIAVEPNPQNTRSPSIDLDSLYGGGPTDEASKQLYQDDDRALLKLDWTLPFGEIRYQNDLPRNPETGEALVVDPRNDENLAVAQTQVAFISFHNKVVAKLRSEGHNPADLFDCARIQVIRHFQWIVLHDFLPMIVDKAVLDSVREKRHFFTPAPEDLYLPLEFSAAAFRLGHSMVRNEYQWNKHHASRDTVTSISPTSLLDLFEQTAFSGALGATKELGGDWVIDWRRFFPLANHPIDSSRSNVAAKIDTDFEFRLDVLQKFPPLNLPPERKSITVRNLLRGLALSLPTGQQVADKLLGAGLLANKDILTEAEILQGAGQDILNNPLFIGKTPLWFYILREAQLKGEGNRLGPVGSRIVAETLFGLIRHSPYSFLKVPDWQPRFTNRVDATGKPIFEMVDLLEFADVVNPYPGP